MAKTEHTNPEQEQALRLLLKLDRGRRRWRFYTIILLLVVVLVSLANGFAGQSSKLVGQKSIARVDFTDLITSDRYALEQLTHLAKNDNVKAVIAYINSPGGTMVAGLEYYTALRQIAAHKPVVAIMGTTAASAGYLISLGADHIVANPATLTGSIGVIMPLVDATQLASKVGIQSDEITSGNLKAVTSPLAQRNAADRAYLQTMVDDLQKTFMAVVTERRTLSAQTLATVRDGRALVGTQALEMGLVDALGGTAEARQWLATTHDIAQDIPVMDAPLTEPHRWLSDLVGEAKSVSQIFSRHQTYGVWAVQD